MGRFDGRLMVLATTFAAREQAEHVVTQLVADELAVCGQIGADLTSVYRWQGEMCREQEISVSLKVRQDRWEACLQRLRELHPYEAPQLLAWPAAYVDDAYGRWAWQE